MTTHNRVIIGLLLLLSTIAYTQEFADSENSRHDFGIRGGINYKKKISDNFSLYLEEEVRFRDVVNTFNMSLSSITFNWRYNDFLSADAGYLLILINNRNNSSSQRPLDVRNRLYANITGHYCIGNWHFSLRERLLVTMRTDSVNPLEKPPSFWTVRSRLLIEHKPVRCILYPYGSVEISNTLNAPVYAGGNYINRVRSTLGIKYKINNALGIDFFYRLDADRSKNICIKNGGSLVEIVNQKDFNHVAGLFFCF